MKTDFKELYKGKSELYERFVALFIHYEPPMLLHAIRNNYPERFRQLGNHSDCINYCFRIYLAGLSKTLHNVYYHIRQMLEYEDSPEAILYIYCLFIDTRKHMIGAELYEMLPLFDKTKNKMIAYIKKTSKIDMPELFQSTEPDYLFSVVNQRVDNKIKNS